MKILAGILLLLSALFSLLMTAMLAAAALLLAGLTQAAGDDGLDALFAEWGIEVPPEVGTQMSQVNDQLQLIGGDVQLIMLVMAAVVAISVPLQLIAAINVFRLKGRVSILLGSIAALALGVVSNLGGSIFTGIPMALGGILGLLMASRIGRAEAPADQPQTEKKGLKLGSLFKRGDKDPDDEANFASSDEESSEPTAKKGFSLGGLFKKGETDEKPARRKASAGSVPMDVTEKLLAGLFALGIVSLLGFAFFRLLEIGAI